MKKINKKLIEIILEAANERKKYLHNLCYKNNFDIGSIIANDTELNDLYKGIDDTIGQPHSVQASNLRIFIHKYRYVYSFDWKNIRFN